MVYLFDYKRLTLELKHGKLPSKDLWKYMIVSIFLLRDLAFDVFALPFAFVVDFPSFCMASKEMGIFALLGSAEALLWCVGVRSCYQVSNKERNFIADFIFLTCPIVVRAYIFSLFVFVVMRMLGNIMESYSTLIIIQTADTISIIYLLFRMRQCFKIIAKSGY